MSKIIRCPHFEQCLDDKVQLLGVATNDGGYGEVCPACSARLVDWLVADMHTQEFADLLTKVNEEE